MIHYYANCCAASTHHAVTLRPANGAMYKVNAFQRLGLNARVSVKVSWHVHRILTCHVAWWTDPRIHNVQLLAANDDRILRMNGNNLVVLRCPHDAMASDHKEQAPVQLHSVFIRKSR